MSTKPAASAQHRRQIHDAISAGNDGRREIVARLARMPIEEFRTVSPQTLAMVGVEGLAELAKQRADLATIAPKVMVTLTRLRSQFRGLLRAGVPLLFRWLFWH